MSAARYRNVAMPPAGQAARGFLTFAHPALREWRWPYFAVSGTRPGPQLLIIAGIHGCEYSSIVAATRFARSLDPAQVGGGVLVLPIVNLPAFWERTPFVCPIDGKNPNRVFPGRADGTFSEALDYHLTEDLFAHADTLIDLHGGDMVEALVPFTICQQVGDADLDSRSEALARLFGLPYALVIPAQRDALGGTTYGTAAIRGVPAIIAEAGGIGQLSEPDVELLARGLRNCARHLGVLPGEPEPVPEPVRIGRFDWLRSERAGLFHPAVRVGDVVQSGHTVGRLDDLFGEPIETITAPSSGVVLFLTTSPAMKVDGLLMGIGVPAATQ